MLSLQSLKVTNKALKLTKEFHSVKKAQTNGKISVPFGASLRYKKPHIGYGYAHFLCLDLHQTTAFPAIYD